MTNCIRLNFNEWIEVLLRTTEETEFSDWVGDLNVEEEKEDFCIDCQGLL